MRTPMADAIFQMLGNLEQRLQEVNAPEHSVFAYIFGGCAVHLYTGARASADLDTEIHSVDIVRDDLQLVLQQIEPVYYNDADGLPTVLSFDENFNTTLGPLHEDYRDRAVVLERTPGSPLAVYLPSPEDLALSKLGRFTDVDQDDIVSLMSLENSSWDLLSNLVEEVSGYYVGPLGDLTGKFNYVRNIAKKGGLNP